MRVVVACEFSGRVRDAFIALGHEAISCDLLPSDREGPHHQGTSSPSSTNTRENSTSWSHTRPAPICAVPGNAG